MFPEFLHSELFKNFYISDHFLNLDTFDHPRIKNVLDDSRTFTFWTILQNLNS